ncbi:MAG: efflux RND transporter periplasmic adaptor subunit [Bacteroidales bacterium]|jgi:RND family efflux transporter MFP subunit|nr:efflux RND transporter periplasmic adaptor subunit [Bacteroidales bacterium]
MKTIRVLSTIAITASILAGCTSQVNREAQATGAVAEDQALPVKVTELKKTTIARSIDFTATVQPYEEVNMSPSTPGRIDMIYVEVGDRVGKGDKLFLMDRTQLMQARIQLANLGKDLARLDTLLSTGSTRQQQYDQVKAQYDVLKSNVDFLEENTLLEAPFSGIITGRYFESGEMYSGAPTAASGGKSAIVTLMQINPVKVTINVSEQYFTQVTSGMPARITSDIFPGEVFSGRVNLVYPTINALTRSFQAEIEVPNKSEKLRPGMFVRVAMDLGEVETFVVSASAVLVQEGTNIRYVFVEENGVVNRVEVAPGKRYDDMIEIISEKLAEGARIVTQGQSRLTSGDKVEVVR